MIVRFANQEFHCTRAEKSGMKAKLYLTPAEEALNGEVVEFFNISDFSVFALEGGEWESPTPTRLDKVESQSTYTAMMTDTLIEEGEDDV